jgi:beta-glucanase (GH16 family)
MKSRLLALLLLAALSCSEEPPEETVAPTDLQVDVQVAQDGSRAVRVTATVTGAEYFQVLWGEPGETPEKIAATGGTTSLYHVYNRKGTYTANVEAHATETLFTGKEIQVVVPGVPPPPIEINMTGYTSPTTYPGMTLSWSDEFNGDEINKDVWVFEEGTGTGGWGNNELEYYREVNTSFKSGCLVITAKRENFSGSQYTSSRIKTQGKKNFKYGRIDIRAILPRGQGIWPAFWFLGSNINTVGWPTCGEIDMVEMIGGNDREKTVYGTLHWNSNGHVCTCDKPGYTLSSGMFNDQFHVFSMEWTETYIKWFVDDVQFNVIDISPAGLAAFRADYFFIMNLAVGGNWPGPPNENTPLPQYLVVDYIRVFQKN